MSFDIDVSRRIGDARICVHCTASTGVTALVGASGTGKTSILNMIAGILRPDHGHIIVNGETLFDSDRRVDMPVAERRAGYVFQDRRLFPHMQVRANLRYGMRERATEEFDTLVDLLGIGALMRRWPSSLSGGEAQRVAIGRALLSNPKFLLLDEPLASLDEARRTQIRAIIARISSELNIPILLVTHDATDVETLATTIVSLFDGSTRIVR